MKICFLFVWLCAIPLLAEETSLLIFQPPQKWKITDPHKNPPHVQIAFVQNSRQLFRPSLNYAIEETKSSLDRYLQIVKNNYSSQKNKIIQDMGEISTNIGPSRLLIISSSSSAGNIKILQSITVHNEKAHILTGAVLEKDFSKYYGQFMRVFTSLRIIQDVFEEISDNNDQKKLSLLYQQIHSKKDYRLFEKTVMARCKNYNAYWQFVLLKKALEKTL
ncbi:MAG: hypothetical protein JW769_03900 [Parachlamydiales bacterium]|nr:hypothetical protein [Parachlamydiales bacterium]